MKQKLIYDILIFIAIVALLLVIKVPFLNVLLPFLLILSYCYKTDSLKNSLGFSKPKNIVKLIGLSLLLALAISILSYVIFLPVILKITGVPLSIGVFEQVRNNSSALFISLIIGWFVGGIMEETIFRGFMISKSIKYLKPKIGATIGVIFSSILFGSLHSYQGISGQILIGFTGLILAIIYLISKRNLWLNILTHGLVNTISMIVLYFDLIDLNL